MDDNEIIKVLECCGVNRDCAGCPKEEEPYGCYFELCGGAFDLINRLKAENEDLFYKLQGVMLSVDKWLESDELKQDEVNRASTMREKTLQITEQQQAEIEEWKTLAHEGKEKVELLEIEKSAMQHRIDEQQAEIERLKDIAKSALNESIKVCDSILNAKSEAYKKFAEKLKRKQQEAYIRHCGYENDVVEVQEIDNLLVELTPETLNKLPHNSLCETETYEGVTDTNVGSKKNDFKEVV